MSKPLYMQVSDLQDELNREREHWRNLMEDYQALKVDLDHAQREVGRQIERCARLVAAHAERLKHTSHREGLGMGWQAGELLCEELAIAIRALATDAGEGKK